MDLNDKSLCRKETKSLLNAVGILCAALFLSACVSNTLSTQNTQPQPIAETPTYDPEQRELAIAEMRAKAAQPESGELTNAFATAEGPNDPLTASEQAARISELKKSVAQNEANVTDAELAAKQKSIRDLQQKARSHYNNAVNTIQN